MTPLALFLLSHGARTIPSSRLAKELIHLGYRPVCFTTWYKTKSEAEAVTEKAEHASMLDGLGRLCPIDPFNGSIIFRYGAVITMPRNGGSRNCKRTTRCH